jgi:hypothetical protein
MCANSDDGRGAAAVLSYHTPIDRAARDALADALAAYLRGEINNFSLDEIAMGKRAEDQTVMRLGRELWFHYDDVKPHNVSATREEWEFFLRIVAFLKSDRVLEDVGAASEDAIRQRRLGFAALGITGAAVALGVWFSAWWLLLPGATLGTWLAVQSLLAGATTPTSSSLDPKCFPFPSEESWLAAAPLVDAFSLPAYEPSIHGRPIRKRSVLSWILSLPGTLLCIVAIIPLLMIIRLFHRRPTSTRP